jgi:hypothetical protein
MRFSIRDLLWLTVVVAMAVGWWVDHGSLSWHLGERDPDMRNFKATIFEQLLKERGVTVYCPRVGTIVVTENGQTQTHEYTW